MVRFRSAVQTGAAVAAATVPAGSSSGCPLEKASAEAGPTDERALVLEAVTWSTKWQDHALVVGVANSLPASVLEEQARLYEARGALAAAPKYSAERSPVLVYPHLLKSTMQVAGAFHEWMNEGGWVDNSRIPRKACPTFLQTMVRWGGKERPHNPCMLLRRWHVQWQTAARIQHPSEQRTLPQSRLRRGWPTVGQATQNARLARGTCPMSVVVPSSV